MVTFWIKNSDKKDKNGKPFQILTVKETEEINGVTNITYYKSFVNISKDKGTVYLSEPIKEK